MKEPGENLFLNAYLWLERFSITTDVSGKKCESSLKFDVLCAFAIIKLTVFFCVHISVNK